MPKFYKKRLFNSDVYVYEFNPIKNPSAISFGTAGKLERLSVLRHTAMEKKGFREVAKINLGYFGGNAEHNGLVMFDGEAKGNPNGDNAECYLDKKGRFVVTQLNAKQVPELKEKVLWGGSLSYSVLVDGEAVFLGANRYAHFKTRNPRTLIGQKANSNIVLVVVEGRSGDSTGVTGKESAEIMKALGCVNAINADGGGSSEMMVRTDKGMTIVNEVSDGRERSIGSALIIFEKV
jgi:exopolysaccharide biosynthesis protein